MGAANLLNSLTAFVFRFSDEHVILIGLHSGGTHFTPLLAVGPVLLDLEYISYQLAHDPLGALDVGEIVRRLQRDDADERRCVAVDCAGSAARGWLSESR